MTDRQKRECCEVGDGCPTIDDCITTVVCRRDAEKVRIQDAIDRLGRYADCSYAGRRALDLLEDKADRAIDALRNLSVFLGEAI